MSILKFVVLSDLHLGLPEQPVNGLDTAARLTEAVQVIARDHSDAAFVLLAGDLADRGEAGAYSLLQSIIVSLPTTTGRPSCPSSGRTATIRKGGCLR